MITTEEQANQAREQHAEFLRQAGAHSILVDRINKKGPQTFAVVALSEKQLNNLPKELEVKKGKNVFKVPLITKVSPKFKLE